MLVPIGGIVGISPLDPEVILLNALVVVGEVIENSHISTPSVTAITFKSEL